MSLSLLEIKEVTKRFGSLTVLNHLSFTLAEGEILGLIGPNGAGKTTLVNAVTGALPISAGDILFLGNSIRGLNPHQISRRGISRTFQVAMPFANMSPLENVMAGALFGRPGRERTLSAARKRALEILDFFQLGEKRNESIENLSVSERKRLELARMLATDPKLLFLDEIMAGLDPMEIDETVALIRNIRERGVTILVIEHVIQAIARLCDRVVVLQQGEKIEDGPPQVVLSSSRVIEAYLGKSYRKSAGAFSSAPLFPLS